MLDALLELLLEVGSGECGVSVGAGGGGVAAVGGAGTKTNLADMRELPLHTGHRMSVGALLSLADDTASFRDTALVTVLDCRPIDCASTSMFINSCGLVATGPTHRCTGSGE